MEDNHLKLKPGQKLVSRGNRFIVVDQFNHPVDIFNENKEEKQNKYRNKKLEINGIKFDSSKEAARYAELMLLEQHGEITDLQRQVKFVLIPTQREPDTVGPRGGIIKGNLLEPECSYYADFTYKNKKGELVVEDVKSSFTKKDKVFSIKKKLMLSVHGIKIHIYN